MPYLMPYPPPYSILEKPQHFALKFQIYLSDTTSLILGVSLFQNNETQMGIFIVSFNEYQYKYEFIQKDISGPVSHVT